MLTFAPSPSNIFDIDSVALQRNILHLTFPCLEYVLQSSVEKIKDLNGLIIKKSTSRRYRTESITVADYADNFVDRIAKTTAYSWVFPYCNQQGSNLSDKPLKMVDQFICLGSKSDGIIPIGKPIYSLEIRFTRSNETKLHPSHRCVWTMTKMIGKVMLHVALNISETQFLTKK